MATSNDLNMKKSVLFWRAHSGVEILKSIRCFATSNRLGSPKSLGLLFNYKNSCYFDYIIQNVVAKLQ